jgi:hypothetical protein
VLAIAPTVVFALALLVGIAKGRFLMAALALVAWAALALVAEVATGTILAGEAPFGDAWIVILLQLASWAPALLAAAGEAREDSPWARSGRPAAPIPIAELAANFVWVFAITMLGVLFDGVDILGAEIFCAAFAAMLAGVMLFGLGSARSQAA